MDNLFAPSLSAEPTAKRDRLLDVLRGIGKTAVAFSGGIDSTVVAKAAHLALGKNAVAVTADSPSVPRAEIADARRLAEMIGIHHIVVPTAEFADPITFATTAPAATSARASCTAGSKRCCRGWMSM